MEHSFHWTQCHQFLPGADSGAPWQWDPAGLAFARPGSWIQWPLVLPAPDGSESLEAYVQGLPDELDRHCMILLQAGALSIGLFEAGQALYTKTIKKYVVRGRGRAQPTHLKTKGKSRYGSRLRLQNAQQLLEEGADRLSHWWQTEGPIERTYVSAPKRLWADFLTHGLPTELAAKEAITRIPLDLPRPTTDLLLRTYRALEYGRILSTG